MKKKLFQCDICKKEVLVKEENQDELSKWKKGYPISDEKDIDVCTACFKKVETAEKKIEKVKDKAREDIKKIIDNLIK